MWDYIAPIVVLLCTYITGSVASICYSGIHSTYCYGGCCGSYGFQYCCTGYYSFSGGSIAGTVVGSIIFVGVIIAICVCVCVRRRAQPGRLLIGGPVSTTTVVATTAVSTPMYPQVYPTAPPNPFAGPPPYNNAVVSYPPNQGLPYGAPPYVAPPYGAKSP